MSLYYAGGLPNGVRHHYRSGMTASLFGLAASVLTLSLPQISPSPAAGEVFQRLAGHWSAEGRRSYPGSKAYVAITAEAQTKLVLNAGGHPAYLVSRNQLDEQPYDSAGLPEAEKTYARVYWIRERELEPGKFDLGPGEDPEAVAPASSGFWDGGRFQVKQDFGGQPAYTIDSETDFTNPDEPLYQEKFWHGQTQLAETALRYLRIP